MAAVGEGNLNFPGIIKKLNDLGTAKYALVEQDVCPRDPFDCLRVSRENLLRYGCTD